MIRDGLVAVWQVYNRGKSPMRHTRGLGAKMTITLDPNPAADVLRVRDANFPITMIADATQGASAPVAVR